VWVGRVTAVTDQVAWVIGAHYNFPSRQVAAGKVLIVYNFCFES
jgi:hypothetical protein